MPSRAPQRLLRALLMHGPRNANGSCCRTLPFLSYSLCCFLNIECTCLYCVPLIRYAPPTVRFRRLHFQRVQQQLLHPRATLHDAIMKGTCTASSTQTAFISCICHPSTRSCALPFAALASSIWSDPVMPPMHSNCAGRGNGWRRSQHSRPANPRTCQHCRVHA